MNKSSIPDMVVDFRRKRMRVPKAALRMIKCPHYVRLLVHPEDRYVAITVGLEGDPLSHRVPDYIYCSKESFEITSHFFLTHLQEYGLFPTNITSCSLKARACLDEQFVVFSFPDKE